MVSVLYGFSILVFIFLLVIILGLQIQITGLSRAVDNLAEKTRHLKK